MALDEERMSQNDRAITSSSEGFEMRRAVLALHVIPLSFIIAVLLSSSVYPTAVRAAEQSAPTSQVKVKDKSRACANKARKQAKKNKKYKYWLCVGNTAKYFKKKRPAHPPLPIASDRPAIGDPGVAPTSTPKGAQRRELEPDDVRCELVPSCTTIRTLFAADIKGNAFYGYGDEVWGGFDVIYTQSFNGASSRYRIKLIWDWGYAVDSDYWTAQVRRDVALLPDPTTGAVYFLPGRISSVYWTQVRPSKTAFESTLPTRHSGRHHDDLYGTFTANDQVFGSTTIHLPSFFCPKLTCRYYGPTGPV